MWDSVADYVHSLGLDAYVVGGAVRDELLGRTPPELDFVVPGVGHAELREALEPYGKVEDLSSPTSAWACGCCRGTRRRGRSSRPGSSSRHRASSGRPAPAGTTSRSSPTASISLEQDMERRDFTINAIARRLETGEILDPLGGRADLEQRRPPHDGPASFRDDPLRIVRGLRFVSQLDVDPDEDTLRQMREWAPRIDHVSGERIGGGLAADGMGELSKLLLGAHPAKALRLARDTGVLVHVLPEFGPAIGYDQQSDRQHLTLDEHVFAVVQAAADAGAPLEVRLAALLHDLGKPEAERGRRRPRRDRRSRSRAARSAGCAIRQAAALRRQARARAPVRSSRTSPTARRCPAVPRPPRRAARARPARPPRRRPRRARRVPAERRSASSGSGDARRAGARRSRTGSPTWPWTAAT